MAWRPVITGRFINLKDDSKGGAFEISNLLSGIDYNPCVYAVKTIEYYCLALADCRATALDKYCRCFCRLGRTLYHFHNNREQKEVFPTLIMVSDSAAIGRRFINKPSCESFTGRHNVLEKHIYSHYPVNRRFHRNEAVRFCPMAMDYRIATLVDWLKYSSYHSGCLLCHL